MQAFPRLSVIMPAYNAAAHISEAVASILSQTFEDFELIVINDGSTDATCERLAEFHDDRLRVIDQDNVGVARALNRAMRAARGELLARHDADDVSAPRRFERQIAFLDNNAAVGLVGARATIIDEDGNKIGAYEHPVDNAALQMSLLFDSFVVSSTAMWRRSVQELAGLHSEKPEHNPPEDFEYWSRIARHTRVATLPEYLLTYRQLPGSLSREKAALIRERVVEIAASNICDACSQITTSAALTLAAAFHRADAFFERDPNIEQILTTLDEVSEALQTRFPNEKEQVIAAAEDIRAAICGYARHLHAMHRLSDSRFLQAMLFLRNWLRSLA